MSELSNVYKFGPTFGSSPRPIDLTRLGEGGGGGNNLPPSGPGGDNGNMEPRIVKLETQMEGVLDTLKGVRDDLRSMRSAQERDFRLLFGAIITASIGLGGLMLGLLALMAHGFKWIP
ncbi:hypothetical protein [Gluconobacter sphaericus]|uniref:Uncharacterized protein n=1 Tax=Gluconobacter sphaericus NBRC 12467 TaxID=1307951 RepID=A0AA37SG81_9PROT|nr:hypothetical protein [Gluconobacter sphaericus]MBF0885546.1 hypothetical protein [Gluconobacter sphaericus]GBR56514.1 hypothetical protein AA12467_2650 [Gluconobacter sphaericus NBRC 12467]GEB42784.1 hypothetical protein GSP01_15660 [Gluconobacter sphaericus NBRC 12467]GLQ84760.1 hypothetical protein GCM10007872_16680 [Gluconobacter sphaericus NBRC 12467]GLQ85085.1 hypothetical protein GCM10007872_19930 [Gluconobacter sphaericus NBRC 12467]